MESATLQSQLKSKLGVDTLDIEAGGDEVARSMVTVGKYLTPKLYISLGRSLVTDATLVTLRYTLSRRWEIETKTGTETHELSHIRHRDILVGTVAATIAGAISYLAQMAQWAMIFGGRSHEEGKGGNPIAALIMTIVGPIAAMMIQMAIPRLREYGADKDGALIAGNPLYLARALKKLHMASQKIPMEANPATSHMFIVNPLSGGGLLRLFSTHPPIGDRISRLEAMALGR